MWKVYLFEFILALLISIFWVMGIDDMSNNHKDYKGDDFLK